MTRKEKRCDGVGVTKAKKERAREDKRQRRGIRDPRSQTAGQAAHPANFVSQGTNSGEEGARAGRGRGTIDNLMMRLRTVHADLLGILIPSSSLHCLRTQ